MKNKQIGLVKNQEQEKQRELIERFEKAVTFVASERQQLLQLKEYENDYLIKINNEQSQWSASNTARYRQFCHQLSQTIGEQEDKLEKAEAQLEKMRGELCLQQQKIDVLNKVISREEKALASIEDIVQQKELDEFSSRLSHHQ